VPRLSALALAITALVVAGCGSSSSSSTTSSTPASTAASSTTTSAAVAAPTRTGVLLVTKHNKLGTILAAGPQRRTVYLFEKDKGPASTCSGDCADDWPPVTTTAAPHASGAAVSADLGTIPRADGTKQVTYKGHPLYFFDDDKDAGDTKGQGSKAFGAGWYVMTPNGQKVDDDDDDDGGDDS
jgi:predicted lipoprotein with Yx(FWY)xxD motif